MDKKPDVVLSTLSVVFGAVCLMMVGLVLGFAISLTYGSRIGEDQCVRDVPNNKALMLAERRR